MVLLLAAFLTPHLKAQTSLTYPAGSSPNSLVFDGANIWVTDYGSTTVTKLLASTGAIVGTYSVGLNPDGVAFDGANIWVAIQGDDTVTKLLASTGATVGTYPVGALPTGIGFDGVNIWVANNSSNTVTELLASTGARVGTYPVGLPPRRSLRRSQYLGGKYRQRYRDEAAGLYRNHSGNLPSGELPR